MSPGAFEDFDFEALNSRSFKEDSVREELVLPLLKQLGYKASGSARINRSRKLEHPFVVIGSKKHKIQIYPDYTLEVDGEPAFVLDAKAPGEDIHRGQNVEQAFSYAIHPDVRTSLYALCNGHELIVFHISQNAAVLSVALSEIDKKWDAIVALVGPNAFRKKSVFAAPKRDKGAFDYTLAKAPSETPSVNRQGAKRHFGVHGYFTKQHWAVVREHIKAFTQPDDVVLDPFGGSGVTLVEALMLGRKAIHVDINPLSEFIVKALITPVNVQELGKAFNRVVKEFKRKAPTTREEVDAALKRYPYPKGFTLPRNSDVETVEQLFSPKQLAQLALLKRLIIRLTRDDTTRATLLLMFSGLINKINLTYHASEGRSEGRGDSAPFRYYRYRLAPKPADIDVVKYFRSRFKKVVAGKMDIAPIITESTVKNAIVATGSATDLSWIRDDSVDYIYTDPPYGSKIQYLDLSVMWTAWLDLPVTDEQRSLEAIEGGEQGKSREQYSELIAESMKEMVRVLKYDRWMSFVFAHQTPAYWHMVVDSAEKAGFEYAGVTKQKTGQTSFKKRQNPFTVLSGQLIITFKKVKNPRTIGKMSLGAPIMDVVMNNIEAVIALHTGATIEEINDELVIRGLELGFLDVLAAEYSDLTPLLKQAFDYDADTQKYNLKKNTKFKTAVPLELRVRYFVVSLMRRLEHQHTYPSFDEVVLQVMPLLKNGVTPERETIRTVLEDVADRIGEGQWRLKKSGQSGLFHLFAAE